MTRPPKGRPGRQRDLRRRDRSGRPAGDFSNWGVNSVDLGAPGTQILSVAPYRYVVKDEFEIDDFASNWVASGADGGFARTDEPPLTSFGMSDSPGATAARRLDPGFDVGPGHACAGVSELHD